MGLGIRDEHRPGADADDNNTFKNQKSAGDSRQQAAANVNFENAIA
jgi:hypothetical protein